MKVEININPISENGDYYRLNDIDLIEKMKTVLWEGLQHYNNNPKYRSDYYSVIESHFSSIEMKEHNGLVNDDNKSNDSEPLTKFNSTSH